MYPFLSSVPSGNKFSSRPGRFTPDNGSLYSRNRWLEDHRADLMKWKTQVPAAVAGTEQ